MASYKVLQDIEAEDKFLGPLTLKQFILAAITAIGLYLSFFFLSKGIWLVAVMLLPIEIVTGFLAFPWGRDQPTETWLLAKLRYYLKPRKRIWDQTGIQELVKITAPKKIEQNLTNGLSSTEVRSRLKALADTIDSRGWVIKNVDVNMFTQPAYGTVAAGDSDRLLNLSSLPQQAPIVDISANDDIFSNTTASRLDQQIAASTSQHQHEAVTKMQQTSENAAKGIEPSNDLWFMNENPAAKTKAPTGYTMFGSQAVRPHDTEEHLPKSMRKSEEVSDEASKALLDKVHRDKQHAHDSLRNHRRIDPYDPNKKPATAVTGAPPADILNLAIDSHRNVESLAREAQKNHPQQPPEPDDEVIIPLR